VIPLTVALFAFFIVVSYLAVTLGALALEITGLDPETARFQALSAFTRSGFTTRESELAVRNPLRRRIISVLIILGNAGLVTIIGTFAASLVQGGDGSNILYLTGVALVLVITARLTRRLFTHGRLHEYLRRTMARTMGLRKEYPDEILYQARGYGLFRADISEASSLASKTLAESRLGERGVIVLAIEREDGLIPIPSAKEPILPGDSIVCYGNLERAASIVQNA
jgi:K+/H+ antiporter YhaU regulatory subunit KhtT